MAFLKQVLVTVLVLVAAFAGTIKLYPGVGRAVLDAGLALPAPLKTAIVWISPEAGEPAPEVAGATPAGPGRGRGATVVVAGDVTIGRTRTRMKAIGSGEAARSVVVYPDNTSGIITAVSVKSGDAVEAGDLLVQLESSSEQLVLDRARILLDAAEDKLKRSRQLERSNALSAVGVTDVLRERDNARLDLKSAEIALDKRQIRAPISGRIGIVSVDTGDLVTSQTVIATVDDRRELNIVFYTPESFVSDLAVGSPITAVSTARPDETYEGRISAIDSRLDEASRTLRTEAIVDNAADRLRPGMSFTVSLALPGETYLAVDPLAVVWERTGPIVWKIVDGKVEKAPVRIIERTIDRMLVASDDIEAGDRIVVEGIQSVREGGPVDVQNAPAGEPTAPAGGEPVADAGDGSAQDAQAENAVVEAPLPRPTPAPRADAARETTVGTGERRTEVTAEGFVISGAQAATRAPNGANGDGQGTR